MVRFPGPVFGVVLTVLLIISSGCLGDIKSKTNVGNFGGTQISTDPSTFTCDYDENHLRTSPEFSGWFNTSCHYNDYCGWWESNDLLPKPTSTVECINCSFDTWLSMQPPTPLPTPCPVRTPKTGRVTGAPSPGVSSGTGDSLGADAENRKVSFTIDCSMRKAEVLTSETDTRIVKVKGNVPFSMARNADKKPLIDGLQIYGSTITGEGAKLDLYSEWNHACTSPQCVPCHYLYEGPVWIGATVMHDPKNTPSDWQVILLPSGETTNAVGSGSLVGYTTTLQPNCPITAEIATTTLVTSVSSCFTAGDWKHMTLADGSEIVFSSNEPNVALDSKAVFHNGG
jgi:hypothetical protein